MKTILKQIILLPLVLVFAAAWFSACSDWNEVESVNIDVPSIEDQNPELYAQYLANLRAYKQTDHKIMYVSFNNVFVPTSRANHLTILPDSIDIVSLMRADSLVDYEMEEMSKIREKGTQIVYTISNTKIETLYTIAKKEYEKEQENNPTDEGEGEGEGEGGEPSEPVPFKSFAEFATEYMDYALPLCDKYGYDGLTIDYEGKGMGHMTDEEKIEYTLNQQAVIGKVAEWKAAHTDKVLIFQGKPQNLVDCAILSECKYIILTTQFVTNVYAHTQQVLAASQSGVPTDRFIVAVLPFSTDKADLKTGYFGSKSAITESAYWVAVDDQPFTKAGLAIFGVQADYFNTSLVYKYTRGALSIMTPAPKN